MDKAVYMKYVSLAVLIVQTTAIVLTLRYSRTVKTEGPRYISSTAVFSSEVMKFVTCLFVIWVEAGWSLGRAGQVLHAEVVEKAAESFKVGIPALLYVVQNNLLFFALSRLDAATYQVTYQLKILTTAFFSVTMLGKRLNATKWIALVCLMTGVALVQLPATSSGKGGEERSVSDQVMGLIAVLAACCSSGFSGVYFEKILKGSQTSLWIRNLQLSFFSIFGALLMVAVYDWEAVSEQGFFAGYSGIIWVVVALQAYGGLIIALVVKYADNILKGFGVSLSIIVSSIMSYFLLGDFQPSILFVVGAAMVIGSTFLYGYTPPAGNPSTPLPSTRKL